MERMQKPQLVQSRRAKKMNRTADDKGHIIDSPLVHREFKERPNFSESKISRNQVKIEATVNSAPPKSKSVKFMDSSASSWSSPAPGKLDFESTKKSTAPTSTAPDKRTQDRSKFQNSGSKSTPQKFIQGPKFSYRNHTTVHLYFGLGVLTFLFIIFGDSLFISLYKQMSQESNHLAMSSFGDTVLPTGRFRDPRYFKIDILSPQDGQIVISPSMKWSVDGVVLGGANDVSRVFYVHATLDGAPLLFPEGNNMTIKLNGQFDMVVDLAHYGLRKTGAHIVTVEMLIIPDPDDLYYFKTKRGSLLLSATANSTFYFIGSSGDEVLQPEGDVSGTDDSQRCMVNSDTASDTPHPLEEEANKKELKKHLAEALAGSHSTLSSSSLSAASTNDQQLHSSSKNIFSESSLSSGSVLIPPTEANHHHLPQQSQQQGHTGGTNSGGGPFSLDLLRKKSTSVTVPETPQHNRATATSAKSLGIDSVADVSERGGGGVSGISGGVADSLLQSKDRQHQKSSESPVVAESLQDLKNDETRVRRMKKFEYTKSLFLRSEGGCDGTRVDEVHLTLFLNERVRLSSSNGADFGTILLSVDNESYDITNLVNEQVSTQDYMSPEIFMRPEQQQLNSVPNNSPQYRFKEVLLKLGGTSPGRVHTVSIFVCPSDQKDQPHSTCMERAHAWDAAIAICSPSNILGSSSQA